MAEKAGRLVRYFDITAPLEKDQQPHAVEPALRHGGAGSLPYVFDPAGAGGADPGPHR